MEVVLILIVLVVVGAAAAVVTTRRRGRRPELEPPPSRPVSPPRPEVPEAAEPQPLPEVAPQPEPQAAPEPEPEPEPEPAEKPRFRDRLGKARSLFADYVGGILSRSGIDDETWDELEEALVRADVGIGTTGALLDDLRTRVKAESITTSAALLDGLKEDLKKRLASADRGLRTEPGGPNVWLFVGVNGVGKTTTIGKPGLQPAR